MSIAIAKNLTAQMKLLGMFAALDQGVADEMSSPAHESEG